MGTEAADFVTEMQNQAEFSGAHIEKVDGLRVEFPDCWGLIRLSNTQQRLSLRFEANSEQALENIKQQFRQQMLQIKPTLRLSF
jgi:phosphomannomutase/phosphoglucomutase